MFYTEIRLIFLLMSVDKTIKVSVSGAAFGFNPKQTARLYVMVENKCKRLKQEIHSERRAPRLFTVSCLPLLEVWW